MNAQNLPILLYYRFRGQLQPVRNLFCYLNIPFLELHLEYLEEQKKYLTQEVLNIISRFEIDKTQVPTLIHGTILINGAYPIMTYICKISNNGQLLGKDIKMRSKILEIMEIYQTKQPQSMVQLFKYAEFACNKNISTKEIDQYAKKSYQRLMNDSNYIRQICQYLDLQKERKYVFGQITLIDFFFMETCVYMLDCHDHKDRVYHQPIKQSTQQSQKSLTKANTYYLSIMKDYKDSMQKQTFYILYRDYLENFSIISSFTSKERAFGLRKIWLGNPKLIQ